MDSLDWCLRDAQHTLLRRFDDEIMVFNPHTWATHLVNESVACVLETLRHGPRDSGQLVDALREAGMEDDAARIAELLGPLLEELQALGLIRRIEH